MKTILDLFDAQVKQQPAAIAAQWHHQTLTYQVLHDAATTLSLRLQQQGVCAEQPIALCLERSLLQLVTMTGVLKAGAAYLPLDSTHPVERLLTILRESQATILLTTKRFHKKFAKYPGKIILLDQLDLIPLSHLDSQPPVHSLTSPNPRHLAYIIYTSGSTGTPKGVLIEHHSVVNYAAWLNQYSHFSTLQRVDYSSNYIFDMAVTTSIVPLMYGRTIVLCDDITKHNPHAYLKHLKANKINLIKITPSYLKALLREIKDNFIPLPDLHIIILGGENLRTADCHRWLQCYPEHTLFNEYGPTEATVAVTQQKIDRTNIEQFSTYIPIGRPGPHMCCHILNDKLEPVAHGERGELYISGKCLARGYLNRPNVTQATFVTNPLSKDGSPMTLYKTGDLCRWFNKDTILCEGRVEQPNKIRGYRIEVGEVEHCLSQHPKIHDTCVIIQNDKNGESRLVAYCVLKKSRNVLKYDAIRKYLQKYLPDYMIPSAFVSLEALPLTPNGKLDHRALPVATLVGSQRYTPPKTTLEKHIAAIWERELGIHLISRYANFHELGGHSLNAVRIVSDIHRKLGKHLTLYDFYQHPTITALAKKLKKSLHGVKKSLSLKPPRWDKIIPLSDFQLLLWLLKTFEPKAQKLNITSRKRWEGRLDLDILHRAFEALFERHEILNYRLGKLLPLQHYQKPSTFRVEKEDLSMHDLPHAEEILARSLHELFLLHHWPKHSPLIMARLFYLEDNQTELQVSLPHLIADEVSMEIVWTDLLNYYQQYIHTPSVKISAAEPFKHYILYEQQSFSSISEEDTFWQKYLEKIQPFSSLEENIIQNVQKSNINYSTYIKIPNVAFKKIEQLRATHHVGVDDILCAAIGTALISQKNIDRKKSLLINLTKSTREDPRYDETIGCFVRVNPIKIEYEPSLDLIQMAKYIHQLMLKHHQHMNAPTLLKLGCVAKQLHPQKTVKFFLTQLGIQLYLLFYSLYLKSFDIYAGLKRLKNIFTKEHLMVFFTSLKRPSRIKKKTYSSNKIENVSGFKMMPSLLKYSAVLANFERKGNFIVNVNVWNNFITPIDSKPSPELPGLREISLPFKHEDVINLDYLLDITFMRDEQQKTPYIVISSNLHPDFRKTLAQTILDQLQHQDPITHHFIARDKELNTDGISI